MKKGWNERREGGRKGAQKKRRRGGLAVSFSSSCPLCLCVCVRVLFHFLPPLPTPPILNSKMKHETNNDDQIKMTPSIRFTRLPPFLLPRESPSPHPSFPQHNPPPPPPPPPLIYSPPRSVSSQGIYPSSHHSQHHKQQQDHLSPGLPS